MTDRTHTDTAWKECQVKTAYPDKSAAEAAAGPAAQNGGFDRLFPYKCKVHTSHWHLTSEDPKDRKRNLAQRKQLQEIAE